ncbi:exonuclease [Candidatus Saccharibacteria bacterium]|nr:MAG: exonuclease [Candidatus Saccharibacteria bacterium]
MIAENQIYIVVDIEADGPAAGLHSMLSLAAVATSAEREISQFYRKLLPLPEAKPDPDTMEWWQGFPEAWQEANTDQQNPEIVVRDFCRWLASLGAEPVFVANPVGLDYTFVSWYLFRYAESNPFMNEKHAIRTIDLRSFIAGKYDLSFNNASRANLPSALTQGMPEHTHRAIDDAVGYGVLVRNLLKINHLV